MPPNFKFQPSAYWIHIVDINSHTEWQTLEANRSGATLLHRAYPGSAGLGLRLDFCL